MRLFRKLRNFASSKSPENRERYSRLLDYAEQFLRQIAQIPIPPDGYLGVLRAIRNHFDFLFTVYGFTIANQKPTGMRLVSGAVAVELSWATQSSLSFALSREGAGNFWIEDLMYLHRDQRCLSVPQAIQLNSEADIDAWFQFLSRALRQYGDEQLTDVADAFSRLAQAQSQRDAEYAAMMDVKHGVN